MNPGLEHNSQENIINPYSYQDSNRGFKLYLKKETPKLLHYSVQFSSAIDIGYPETSLIKGELYLPKAGHKVSLAILVHGMGDYSVIPCRWLAGSLLKKGVACFIPYLVIHSMRISESLRERMPYLTPDEWFKVYQVSVVDIRQVIDWAYTREELDRQRIATVGISFGGFVSSIAMGIDNRVKAGIFIVSGGNQNKMSWLSQDSGYREKFPRSEEEHLAVQHRYSEYLDKVSRQGFENVSTDNNSFLTDPMTFAGKLKGRPIFMINALNDKYIPKEAVIDFWQALGEPPIRWISSGHTSLWLHYPSIRRDTVDFLKSSGIISF